MEIEGKVILVTGGSSGIGKATCEHFASLGAKVSICDVDVDKGEALAKELNENYGKEVAIFNRCDIRDIDNFRECFKATIARFKRVDILHNNAGIFDDGLEGWSRVVDINVKGTINGCLVAVEIMGTNNGGKGGTVISTASTTGLMKSPTLAIYGSTKAALIHLTRSLGMPLHFETHNVRFMCVCPHLTMTPLAASKLNLLPWVREVSDPNPKFIKADQVARCVEHAFKHGENGSAWLVLKDKPFRQVQFRDLTESSQESTSFEISV